MNRHRLSPQKYRELKIQVYERDRWCRTCGITTSLTPHHIISRGMGGGDYRQNMICLCVKCHGEVEQGKKVIPDEILKEIGFFELDYNTANRMQSE